MPEPTIHALFLCGRGRMRSPTAVQIAMGLPNVAAESAGISRDADDPVSLEQVQWADVICVMEPRQRKRLNTLFGPYLKNKAVAVLNVPDVYDYMDEELIAVLEPKIRKTLRR
jgi:predicted protein tyrosine phosphatase